MASGEGPPREVDPGQTPEGERAIDPARRDLGHERRDEDDDEGRIGIFKSWRSLYVTVVLYTAALTVLLYVLTRLLDHSS